MTNTKSANFDNPMLHSSLGFCENDSTKGRANTWRITINKPGPFYNWRTTKILWQKAATPSEMTGDSYITKFYLQNQHNHDFMGRRYFETGITKYSPKTKVHIVDLPQEFDSNTNIHIHPEASDNGYRQGRVDAVVRIQGGYNTQNTPKIAKLFKDHREFITSVKVVEGGEGVAWN